MKRRRAQFFAPALKTLDQDRNNFIRRYDDYVRRKYRLRVDPSMIDENFTKKTKLYRCGSSEALLRERDVLAFEALKPAKGVTKKRARVDFDLRDLKHKTN